MVLVPLAGTAAPQHAQNLGDLGLFGSELAPANLPAVVDVHAVELTLMNPLSGEIIDPDSVDDMIDQLESIKAINRQLYAVELQLRDRLAALTEGDAKTRRIRGERRAAKIEMPGLGWEQSKLKEAFAQFPEFRDEVLKIDSIGVKLAEYKKLKNTSSDDPEFLKFRDAITAACKGPTGNPSVTVEK